LFERHPQTFLLLKGSASRASAITDTRGRATDEKLPLTGVPDAVLTTLSKMGKKGGISRAKGNG
jgi:hypothetical protein